VLEGKLISDQDPRTILEGKLVGDERRLFGGYAAPSDH
jgi:hypothetical protein